MRKRILSLLLVVSIGLTGCADKVTDLVNETQKNEAVSEKNEYVKSDNNSLGSNLNIVQELPVSTVKVMVDQNGYGNNGPKSAIFVGEDLDSTFRLINKETKQTVYEGELVQLDAGNHIFQGDFTEYMEKGNYFIEMDRIGRSYDFSILDDTYKDAFENIICIEVDKESELTPKRFVDIAFGINILQLALKNHGKSFENLENSDFITRLLEISEWMLACQDKKTGAVLEDFEATSAFCAVLTLGAMNFGKYDQNVSRQYNEACANAWRWLERQGQNNFSKYASARFYAASSLFYKDGNDIYKQICESYLKSNADSIMEDTFAFLGTINYLDSPKKADRDLCTTIMQRLVKESEVICVQNKENSLTIYSEDFSKGMLKILLICFVDYVTPSEEYALVQENMLHYMMGRNETGRRYLDKDFKWIDTEKTVSKGFVWDSILIYMLSDLVAEK